MSKELKRRGRVRAFTANQQAATTVELALIVVPFMGILASIFEIGFSHFRLAQLQAAADTASRDLLTNGYLAKACPNASEACSLTYRDFINREVCTWKSTGVVQVGTLGQMFDCDKVYASIWITSRWEYNATGYRDAQSQDRSMALPASGQIAILKIWYPVAPFFSILALDGVGGITKIESDFGMAIDGRMQLGHVYALVAYTAFRVEPN